MISPEPYFEVDLIEHVMKRLKPYFFLSGPTFRLHNAVGRSCQTAFQEESLVRQLPPFARIEV